MSELTIVLISVAVLLLFIAAEVPIWVGLLSSGTVGLLLLDGFRLTYLALGTTAYQTVSSYSLFIIPMFVLMGVLASNSGIAEDIYAVARRLTRWLPGGLGVATIFAAGGFSAVTGSSGATVATIGRVSVGEMTRAGYKASPSAALVAAGGTLGVLIPPSIILVVYGSLTSNSIGTLLIAAVVPGIVTLLAYAATVIVLYKMGVLTGERKAKKRQKVAAGAGADVATGGSTVAADAASVGPVTAFTRQVPRVTRKNIIGTIYTLLLFGIVIGGIYSGKFTATESGAIAAAVAVLILAIRHTKDGPKKLGLSLISSFREATSMSTMIFGLLIGGAIFSYFLIKTGIPSQVARAVETSGFSSYGVLVIALLIMLILGCFLDSLSILLIAMPLMYPLIAANGLDPIWFGILVVKAIEIGLITPPFGINVYVALGTHKNTRLDQLFKYVVPFIVTEFILIVLIIFFPEIVTFLPDLMAD